MEEIRVGSWSELQERLFDDAWQAELGRFRSNYAFRGRADAAEDLRSSLIRLGGDARNVEGYLLGNFRKHARRGDVPIDSLWNWLALGQHHGLPTRLLDWTYSPFVALHFATWNLERYDRDEIVWCLDYVRAHAELPEELADVLEHRRGRTSSHRSCSRGQRRVSASSKGSPTTSSATSSSPAVARRPNRHQYALFGVLSSPTAALDEWLEARPELCRRIVIPAELKWEVRDKLDQADITERVVFPGLDGLSSWLNRSYRPRDEA